MNQRRRTPDPAPGRARHRALCAGPVARRPDGVRSCTSCRRTRRRSGRARRRSRPITRRRRQLDALSRRLARRAPRGDRRDLWPQPRPHRLRRRVGRDPEPDRARPISARATRRSTREYGFLVYPIAIRAAGGTPVVAPEKDLTTDVDAILARVDARRPASSSSPIRTIRPAPTCRSTRCAGCTPALPPRRAPRPRRGLCRICAAQRLRERHRARRHRRQRGDDAHLLEDLRPGRPPHRLVLWRRRRSIDALNRIRGPFNVSSPAIAAGVAALGDRGHIERAVAHNETWLPKVTRGDRRSSA